MGQKARARARIQCHHFVRTSAKKPEKNGEKWQKEQDIEVEFDGENATHSSVKVPAHQFRILTSFH